MHGIVLIPKYLASERNSWLRLLSCVSSYSYTQPMHMYVYELMCVFSWPINTKLQPYTLTEIFRQDLITESLLYPVSFLYMKISHNHVILIWSLQMTSRLWYEHNQWLNWNMYLPMNSRVDQNNNKKIIKIKKKIIVYNFVCLFNEAIVSKKIISKYLFVCLTTTIRIHTIFAATQSSHRAG